MIFKRQLSQSLHFSCEQSILDAHGIERLLNFKFNFDYIKALFFRRGPSQYATYDLILWYISKIMYLS